MREKLKNMKWIIISALILVVLIAVGVSVKASGNTGIAKSKTFTENMDGYYVYFRAVDEAGNVGDWSNAQRIWIDTTAPTVTAKESSVTIKEGDVNALADYFTVVANGTNSDVDVVCTIGEIAYTTTETLTVEGSPYTVVCTATKKGGKSNEATMELVVEAALPEEDTILAEWRIDYSEAGMFESIDGSYEFTVPAGVEVVKIAHLIYGDANDECGTVGSFVNHYESHCVELSLISKDNQDNGSWEYWVNGLDEIYGGYVKVIPGKTYTVDISVMPSESWCSGEAVFQVWYGANINETTPDFDGAK